MGTSGSVGARAPLASGPALHALVLLVFALFFFFGGITSLNDVLVPKLKGLFQLDYAEAMLTQFAFFAAYFFISLPAGVLVSRIGYMRAAVVGLAVMAAGCLLFVPAAGSGLFWTFLVALFVLAAGVTIVQVVANPLISALGNPATASSRLTFAQAFNSLGTTIMPYLGSQVLLGSVAKTDPKTLSGATLLAFQRHEAAVIGRAYIGLAVVLALAALVFWFRRRALPASGDSRVGLFQGFELLQRPRFALGTLCIFLYVGAEVTIGSVMVSYLSQPTTLALSEHSAGERLSLYWGGAMVGRFIGSWVLRMFSPGKVLATVAAIAAGLVLVSISSTGHVAGWTLLAVGLFNSIMFPTIFSLASEGLGDRASEGSGIICMAIVGGAIVPFVTGKLADMTSLTTALLLPVACYGVILAFGWFARKPVSQ
ncbi:sugar MFS transporter [Sphingomonas sp. MMS24-J13]|uniref:sugar MFS transporter n=1 Tax=Sphingomonas sp. MMS24-J13 TaxID=3238686 RepID=UPI00384EB996